MFRSVRPILALLALLVLVVSPVFAVDAEAPDAAPGEIEAPALDEQVVELPNLTPAPQEDLEIPTEPGHDLRVDAIRACTGSEKEQCPPGCHCIFVSNTVRCFC